jgi:hypothetical protein
MPNTPENNPQLPGLETPKVEFNSANVAKLISDSAEVHKDAIAERYDEVNNRRSGQELFKDEATEAGEIATSAVISIDHIDEDPTPEEKEGAIGRHPASWDNGIENLSIPNRIKKAREHIQSIPTIEEKRAAREEELRRELLSRARTSQPSSRPQPPIPPKRSKNS